MRCDCGFECEPQDWFCCGCGAILGVVVSIKKEDYGKKKHHKYTMGKEVLNSWNSGEMERVMSRLSINKKDSVIFIK